MCALALSVATLFPACSGKATSPRAVLIAPMPLAEELRPLQGQWEGEGAGGRCVITIVGNSLHYRNSPGWYATKITVPAGANPQQLHATIQECSPPAKNVIGTVIFALFKFEDGALVLAEDDASDKPPKSFAEASSRYIVRKIQPRTEKAESSKPK
jgi:hypothetical protein